MAALGRKPLAASAEPISTEPANVAWKAVRRRIHALIEECNCVAGEPIWEVVEEAEVPERLKVRDRSNRSSFVELSLNAVKGIVCDFRSSPRHDRWTFQIVDGGAGLRRPNGTHSIEDAVNIILDSLVCA